MNNETKTSEAYKTIGQVARELGLINTLPRLVAAQAESANPLYLSYKNGFTDFVPTQADFTQATAIQIGNPVSAPRAVPILQTFDGIVEQASEHELSQAAAMADKTGLFSCPQTGGALAVVKKLAEGGVIHQNEKVIVISTATGLKFTDFKRGYHQGVLPEVLPEFANQPVELKGDYKSVTSAISGLIN